MLLAGWEVRIGKNFDRGLENAAFSSPRSRFFPIRTDPKPDITFLSLSLFLAVNWITSGFLCATLSLSWLYAPSTNHSQKRENNERTSQYLQYKERCVEEQIYFELLYVSCISFTS